MKKVVEEMNLRTQPCCKTCSLFSKGQSVNGCSLIKIKRKEYWGGGASWYNLKVDSGLICDYYQQKQIKTPIEILEKENDQPILDKNDEPMVKFKYNAADPQTIVKMRLLKSLDEGTTTEEEAKEIEQILADRETVNELYDKYTKFVRAETERREQITDKFAKEIKTTISEMDSSLKGFVNKTFKK